MARTFITPASVRQPLTSPQTSHLLCTCSFCPTSPPLMSLCKHTICCSLTLSIWFYFLAQNYLLFLSPLLKMEQKQQEPKGKAAFSLRKSIHYKLFLKKAAQVDSSQFFAWKAKLGVVLFSWNKEKRIVTTCTVHIYFSFFFFKVLQNVMFTALPGFSVQWQLQMFQ